MAADYCEPTRQYPGVEVLREAVMGNLRDGLIRVLRHKEQYLLSKGRSIHHGLYDTLAALQLDGQSAAKEANSHRATR